MLNVQFDGDVLAARPDGPITREDVATLTRAADEYLADHPKITGVMVATRTFPGFASVGAFADYARFIADHHAHVRRRIGHRFSSRAGRGVHGQSRRWGCRCGTTRLPMAQQHRYGSGRPESGVPHG
jgi:hypothetical protein